MHLVWPALGAVAATLACVAAALGLMRLTLREQPSSMAALIGVLADPGSNRNPVSLDGRLLVPRSANQPAGRRSGRCGVCAGGGGDP
jgi:hypothetical protein